MQWPWRGQGGRGHAVIAGGLASIAAAEWLRSGAAVWAWVAALAGLAAVALAVPLRRQWLPLAAALASLALGIVLAAGAFQIWRIECCWPAIREKRVTAASRALQSSLDDAIAEARRLAERGANAALLPREAAFDRLDDAVTVGGSPIERGAAVLASGPDPHPIAWSGRHRTIPALDTTELQAVMTPFYAVLEARRQTQGGVAVGSVLLSAAPAVPDGDRALAATFAREHGVTLHFFPAGMGPRDSNVFEICPPPAGCEHGDTLFSVQTIPPSQGDAKLAAVAQTARLAGITLTILLVILLIAAPPGVWRWGVVLSAAWTLLRAPAGPSALFSPATVYPPPARVVRPPPRSVFVGGFLPPLAPGGRWRRGARRRWWHVAVAGLLVLAAPYLVRYFGRGIAPPAAGVNLGLWLSWQAALAVTPTALIPSAAPPV